MCNSCGYILIINNSDILKYPLPNTERCRDRGSDTKSDALTLRVDGWLVGCMEQKGKSNQYCGWYT